MPYILFFLCIIEAVLHGHSREQVASHGIVHRSAKNQSDYRPYCTESCEACDEWPSFFNPTMHCLIE